MRQDDLWVLFEVEGSGMKRPFYVVEIAAQRMRGYQAEGMPFRVLLDHSVPIDVHAQAVHGYTEEYLCQHGQEPRLAHSLFREYVGALPLVSHNLAMDWDRHLAPECNRLGIPLPGARGFCALALARRVLPEASSFSLSALNRRYELAVGDLRGSAPDVEALVQLFEHWFGPRLTAAGIVGYADVAEFSRKSPVAKCRNLVEQAVKNLILPVPTTPEPAKPSPAATLEEFRQLVQEIMADGVMTTAEFLILMDWLRDCPHPDLYPLNRLWEGIQRVTAAEGKVTCEDQERLEKAMRYYLETGEAPPRPGETQAPRQA